MRYRLDDGVSPLLHAHCGLAILVERRELKDISVACEPAARVALDAARQHDVLERRVLHREVLHQHRHHLRTPHAHLESSSDRKNSLSMNKCRLDIAQCAKTCVQKRG